MEQPREDWQQGPGLIEAVWRHRWWILVATVVFAAVGYGSSLLQDEVYEAEVRLILTNPQASGVFGDAGRFVDMSQRVIKETERMTSQDVLAAASERLESDVSATELRERVTADHHLDLDAIEITARAPTPQLASSYANAVGLAYQDVVAATLEAQAELAIAELNEARQEAGERVRELQSRMEGNPGDGSLQAQLEVASQQVAGISSRIQDLALNAALFGSGVDIFEHAEPPLSPVRPRPLRNAAAAAVFAAFAASAVAWWRAEYTQVADAAGDAAAVLAAPSLGEVPVFRPVERHGDERPLLSKLDLASIEAYHFLVASLQFALDDVGGKAVAVTSLGPGDGKTITAMNLGLAAAQDGSRVVLVDGDERRRTLSTRLQLDGQWGLTDMVIGKARPEACLHRSSVTGAASGLLAVPAGNGRPTEVAGFFRRPGFRAAIQALKERSDLLLVDTPPLFAVSDILPIANQVDGVLVVVERGTPLRRLREGKERLDLVGTPILGFVFNRAKSPGGRSYNRYYDASPAAGPQW